MMSSATHSTPENRTVKLEKSFLVQVILQRIYSQPHAAHESEVQTCLQVLGRQALHHKNHFLDSLASTERSWHQSLCAWEIAQCQHEKGPL